MRLILLTTLVMIAFAANSLLCREALASGAIGPASFTLIRLGSGALCLWLLVGVQRRRWAVGGSWAGALALFAYAAAFSFAYLSLSAGTGALLLFGAVQITMIGAGLARGERLGGWQLLGSIIAVGGLAWLLWPGVQAPSWLGAGLMIVAGVAWGAYSLLGRGGGDPTVATAGNFIRSLPIAVLLLAGTLASGTVETLAASGIWLAVASGALASGLGYALWYAVLPRLQATTAATVQLSVPVIAALGGILWLGEALSLRFGLAAVAVLGGIAVFILGRRR